MELIPLFPPMAQVALAAVLARGRAARGPWPGAKPRSRIPAAAAAPQSRVRGGSGLGMAGGRVRPMQPRPAANCLLGATPADHAPGLLPLKLMHSVAQLPTLPPTQRTFVA